MNNTNIPYLEPLYIKENLNNSINLKIDSYHFFPKRFLNETKIYEFDSYMFDDKKLRDEISKSIPPDEKTFFLYLKDGVISGLNEVLKKFISIGYNSPNFITIYFNNDILFSSPANLNIVFIENDFSGTIEFKSSGGIRSTTKNTFENSLNILHYQIHQSRKKSLYIFNFEDINNNPIGSINGKLKENETLPVFFNYYNLTTMLSQNYQDSNFVFNLSVPSNINFFQSEQKNTILKNNVMINTLKNPFTNEETKINVNYFHCLDENQNRDDSFEINHLSSHFHSEISYFVLNKGSATSQVNTYISPDSPFIKSHQKLKHILLSDKAVSFSKPNLMIENPNVESSHGNTMGGFNRDNLIYLRQRGITEEKAKNILATSAIENSSNTPFFSNAIKQYFIK